MAEDRELERIKRRIMGRLLRRDEGSIWADGVVADLTAADFDKAVAEASRPVLVDFWADWCAPCRAMKPVMEALAGEYAGRVSFAEVNIDRNERLAQRHGIMSIPHLILFKDGRPVERVVGAVGRPGLESVLRKHLA